MKVEGKPVLSGSGRIRPWAMHPVGRFSIGRVEEEKGQREKKREKTVFFDLEWRMWIINAI